MKGYKFQTECPSDSGWCISQKQDYEKCIPFLISAYKNAIQALEKQIPKKIEEVHCDEYYCPNCHSENLCDQYVVSDKFCPNCGQALEERDER